MVDKYLPGAAVIWRGKLGVTIRKRRAEGGTLGQVGGLRVSGRPWLRLSDHTGGYA